MITTEITHLQAEAKMNEVGLTGHIFKTRELVFVLDDNSIIKVRSNQSKPTEVRYFHCVLMPNEVRDTFKVED